MIRTKMVLSKFKNVKSIFLINSIYILLGLIFSHLFVIYFTFPYFDVKKYSFDIYPLLMNIGNVKSLGLKSTSIIGYFLFLFFIFKNYRALIKYKTLCRFLIAIIGSLIIIESINLIFGCQFVEVRVGWLLFYISMWLNYTCYK